MDLYIGWNVLIHGRSLLSGGWSVPNKHAYPEEQSSLAEKDAESSTSINAFRLISMASSVDLSGFFEKEKRKTFDENFLRKDTSSIYKLVNAAHYLQLRPLYKKTCSAIARKIEDESPEEICRLFNFPDLFLLEKIRPNIYISAIFQPHFHNRLVKFLIS
ncbi:hypothetical protein ACET3Z_022453 [Daucus carota]